MKKEKDKWRGKENARSLSTCSFHGLYVPFGGGEEGISVCSGTLQVFLKSTYVSPHLCVSYHLHASITGEKPYVHIIGLLSLYMPMNVILGV